MLLQKTDSILHYHCTEYALGKMEIQTHNINNLQVAEVISDGILISNTDDGLDLVGTVYFRGFDRVIIHEKNIIPLFFDLKSKIAGEILQKFTNYRVRLAIVGDFSKYESPGLKDFIYESNRGTQVNFVSSLDEAMKLLSKQ